MPTKTSHPYIPAIYTQIDRGTYGLQVCGFWFIIYVVHLSGSHFQLTICSIDSELSPVQSTFTTIEQELYTLHITDTLEEVELLFRELVEESAVLLRSSYGHPGVLVNLIHDYGGKSPLAHNKKQRFLNHILH